MRRTLLVLTVGAIMAALLAMAASPAVADHRDHDLDDEDCIGVVSGNDCIGVLDFGDDDDDLFDDDDDLFDDDDDHGSFVRFR